MSETYPKRITRNFEHPFSVPESGLYALNITASCRSGKQVKQYGGEDLKVEIDGVKFREMPPVARAQHYDIPAAWNGTQLRGLKKTVTFILRLTPGEHTVKFTPYRGTVIESEPAITPVSDTQNIALSIEGQAENGDRRPWHTVVLVDLPLKSFSADATANWRLRDSDDIKLIVDSQVKQNPDSLFRRNWLWAGSIFKKFQRKERQKHTFEENLRSGLHYIEFWADRKPTLHQVTLDVGEIKIPRVPTANDPKWTGSFSDDPEQIILARAIFGEARNELLTDESRTAVGWSIRNRVEDPRQQWGSTYHDVITQPKQYSAFNPEDKDNYPFVINPFEGNEPANLRAWPRCYEIARQIISNEVDDPTNGSDHYYDESIDTPSWASPETLVVKIGPFFFHKL